MLKQLLNHKEAETDTVLRQACESWSARVFAKVRVADVLPIEGSGITASHYRFALQSHFDFTVTDDAKMPLFSVEFDGAGHAEHRQARRDAIKDELCERFDLPLLRINSNYLKTFRTMNVLSWFVEAWFGARAFAEAQETGAIPYDEPYDPMWFIMFPGKHEWFPMQLGYDIRRKLHRLSQLGKCRDFAPSYYCGVDARENYRIIAYIRITDDVGACAESGMRCQRFGISPAEVLDELVLFDLWEQVEGILSGKCPPTPLPEIYGKVKNYRSRFEMRCAGSVGRIGDSLTGPEPVT